MFYNKTDIDIYVVLPKLLFFSCILVCYDEAKLICVIVFAYADCWFSHKEAHIMV